MRAFIGREELKLLMQSTFVTWSKVCQFHKIPPADWHLNGQYNYIELKNGSQVDLLDVDCLPSAPSTNASVRWSTPKGHLEDAEIHELAFEVLRPASGDTLTTSTVYSRDWAHREKRHTATQWKPKFKVRLATSWLLLRHVDSEVSGTRDLFIEIWAIGPDKFKRNGNVSREEASGFCLNRDADKNRPVRPILDLFEGAKTKDSAAADAVRIWWRLYLAGSRNHLFLIEADSVM
jgi:hypothetical protein